MRPSGTSAFPPCWRLALIILACVGAAAGGGGAAAATAGRPLPASSLYQLEVPLTDQNGLGFQLDARRGQPLLITMFYSSCQFACPRIMDALKRTQAGLTPAERSRVPVLAVTFDPARDDVAALKGVIDGHRLDTASWTLARTDPANVRKLAAALRIKYRALADGDFNHTSVLILLDADGRVAGKTFTIGAVDPVFVRLLKKTLAQADK